MLMTVKIGTVDTEDAAFARVHLTFIDKTKRWHHFKSKRQWKAFYLLWAELQKPWNLRFNPQTGRYFPMKERLP